MTPKTVLVITILTTLILYIKFRYHTSREHAELLVEIFVFFSYVLLIVILSRGITRLILLLTLIIIYRINLDLYFLLISSIINPNMYSKTNDDSFIRKRVLGFLNRNYTVKNNFSLLPSHPTIFLANYTQDGAEYICCVSLPVKMAIVMADDVYRVTPMKKWVKHCIIRKKGSYENIKNETESHLRNMINVFCYVSIPVVGKVGPLRSGMFRIAKELGVTITPVYLDNFRTTGGVITGGDFHITIGETFQVNDIEKSMIRTKKFLDKEYERYNGKSSDVVLRNIAPILS